MLILGQNSNEVGTNLERLTKRLLEHMGHRNIVVNQVGAGGEELDVVSDFTIQLPGGGQNRRVITECKAYRDPINISAWLKFLGKVYVEEAKLGSEVTGLFVALSGVNGNVAGNYDELKTHRSNVNLVSGTTLHSELSQIYRFPEPTTVVTKLQTQTNRAHLSVELAYFNENFYWAVTYPDQAYTLLDLNGEALSADNISTLRPLIEKRLAVTTFVDLRQEATRLERQFQLSKLMVGLLFQGGGEISKATLIPADLGFSPTELEESFLRLTSQHILRIEGDQVRFEFEHAENKSASFAECVLFLLRGNLIVETVSRTLLAEHFKRQLTAEFINHISAVQRGLIIPEADHDWILAILAASPSALAYALVSDPMIVTHREHQPEVQSEATDANDYSIFKRSILEAVASDFSQPTLRGFYLEGKGIVEMETVKRLVLKSSQATILDQQVIERHGLARGAPEIGGGIVRILMFENAPQPWQPGGLGYIAPSEPPAASSDPNPGATA